MQEVKILFLAANPSNSDRLSLDEEAREITNKIRSSDYHKSLVFKARWAVRPDDLLQALNEERPQIVHFSGHGGGEVGLVFHNDNEKPTLISASALKLLFQTLKDNISVVLLNACYSQEQAQKVVEIIDCVIGMRSSVLDETSIKFAASFYRALGFGRSVKNAFEQGLVAIALANLDEEEIPVLLTRDGVDPNTIFFVENSFWKTRFSSDSASQETANSKMPAPRNKTLSRRAVAEHLEDAQRQLMLIQARVDMDMGVGDHFLTNDLPQIIENMGSRFPNTSLLMVDIDELTIINKVFKEVVGNQVLSSILDILKGSSETEFIGRCGDDTYYIFLPGLNAMEAKEVAENLRLAIQNYEWRSIASNLKVTCSFGVSEIHNEEPVRDWIVRAACGMIFAKESGRNRVVFGPDYLSAQQSRILRDYYSGGVDITYPIGSVTFPFE
jgi:diguanylate cyclase (GGDEF)-like protein